LERGKSVACVNRDLNIRRPLDQLTHGFLPWLGFLVGRAAATARLQEDAFSAGDLADGEMRQVEAAGDVGGVGIGGMTQRGGNGSAHMFGQREMPKPSLLVAALHQGRMFAALVIGPSAHFRLMFLHLVFLL
jgi:hypothetical protein